MTVVLDASALLAYWLDETGANVVAAAVAEHGAMVAAPNLAEALTKLVDRQPELGGALPMPLPLAGGAITIEPFSVADAVLCPQVRTQTRGADLSLGDRACLALGQRTGSRVLTADRAWAGLSVGVTVEVIR